MCNLIYMADSKPDSMDSYLKWLEESHRIYIDDALENRYGIIVDTIKRHILESAMWRAILKDMPIWRHEYQVTHGCLLFNDEIKVELCTKPFTSFIEKTYRKNIILNKCWPDAPAEGWYLPLSCLENINDIVRTTIVVKYIDGVKFTINKLVNCCNSKSTQCKADYEARDEGCYAAHFYYYVDCSIPAQNWKTENITISFEVQVTTQLQEVIKVLLHKYYEGRRVSIAGPSDDWKWNYQSTEFATNYLGHILHYIEGMIVDVRDRNRN